MNNLLITYTYNNLIPNAIVINKHVRTLTLNMHFKDFHTPALLQGLLHSMLDINASDALIEAILTYPEDVEKDKNVTVLLDVDGFGS